MTALKYFIPQQLEKREREQLQQVFKFSEIRIANFEPEQGSEDAGVGPTIFFQNDTISRYTTTVISISLTTNLRRASVPSSVFIPGGEDQLKIRLHCVIKCEFWSEQDPGIKLVNFIQRAGKIRKYGIIYLGQSPEKKSDRSYFSQVTQIRTLCICYSLPLVKVAK